MLVGEDLEPQRGTTALIRDGTIIQVGHPEDVDIPPEATVLDVSEYTLQRGGQGATV